MQIGKNILHLVLKFPSWFKGYPELGTPCAPEFYKLVDASNPNTYQFVGDFLSYVTGVFPSNYIHLGSDEVRKKH